MATNPALAEGVQHYIDYRRRVLKIKDAIQNHLSRLYICHPEDREILMKVQGLLDGLETRSPE
jgi:hypothetical protein